MASRLAGALLAEGKQTTEPCIGRAISGIDQHRHTVDEIETAADDQPHAGGLRGLMGADDAGQAVAIDDRQRLDAQHRRLGKQLLAGTRSPQEGEV
jgi:hypothetical protein